MPGAAATRGAVKLSGGGRREEEEAEEGEEEEWQEEDKVLQGETEPNWVKRQQTSWFDL